MTTSEGRARTNHVAYRYLVVQQRGSSMKVSVRGRALVTVAAAASLLAVPLAMPATAALPQPGKCTKLATKTVAGKITATLTSCTPLAATGGKGTGTFT